MPSTYLDCPGVSHGGTYAPRYDKPYALQTPAPCDCHSQRYPQRHRLLVPSHERHARPRKHAAHGLGLMFHSLRAFLLNAIKRNQTPPHY